MLARLRKNPVRKALLAHVLPGVAGAVNASGFFAVGVYTSHMTGNVARVGEELALGHREMALFAASLVAAFIFGAMVATFFAELSRRMQRARYSLPLVIEGVALIAVTLRGFDGTLKDHPGWLAAIAFAMGLQNALVTRISGAVVRTTHLTGVSTDIGMELVRIGFWLRDQMRTHTLGSALKFLMRVYRHSELERLWLHVSIFLAFAVGAAIGPALYVHAGERSLLLPGIVVLLLAAFDGLLGLDPAAALNPDSGPHDIVNTPL